MEPVAIPLILELQPEGGYTVTSPAVPGLVTEGETIAEALEHAWDALLALLDGYSRLGWPLPLGLPRGALWAPDPASVRFDYQLISAA